MAAKRYIPFILLTIIVSASVALATIYFWDQNQVQRQELATATSMAATAPVATAKAIATASAPPAAAESAEDDVLHIVKSGEALGAIAQQYDVPLEDIIRVNNLANPDILSVGDELIIPVGGIPTPTLEPTPSPTSAEPPTPIPTAPPAAGEARLVILAIAGVGELDKEAVTIVNEGSRGIDLSNWTLEDSQGNVYPFPPFYLYEGGVPVVLHSGPGTDTTKELYWGLLVPVWGSGETATLRDPDGVARATFTAP